MPVSSPMAADETTIVYRMGRAEKDIERLWEQKADAGTVRDAVTELRGDVAAKAATTDVERLERAVGRMTTAFYTLAVGIVLASVGFAFAAMQIAGGQ